MARLLGGTGAVFGQGSGCSRAALDTLPLPVLMLAVQQCSTGTVSSRDIPMPTWAQGLWLLVLGLLLVQPTAGSC